MNLNVKGSPETDSHLQKPEEPGSEGEGRKQEDCLKGYIKTRTDTQECAGNK